MFHPTLTVALLCALASAIPTANVAIKVHIGRAPGAAQVTGVVMPGPGMPSLEQLGVTSEQLYSSDFEPAKQTNRLSTPARLFKRQAQCLSQNGYEGTRVNAIACRNYLIQSGTATCSTGATSELLCSAGDTEIVGVNYFNFGNGVSTSCSDAAVAAAWVIDNCSACPQDSCLVEGQQAGTDNPNFIASIDFY